LRTGSRNSSLNSSLPWPVSPTTPPFLSPIVDLKAVQAAVDELNAALVAQACGGTTATAEKKNRQEALVSLLRKLKHYVEDTILLFCSRAASKPLQQLAIVRLSLIRPSPVIG
jgi:hypothetical protein